MGRERQRSVAEQEQPRSSALRCAIYTRKSTEEGLDREFNTLEAQREAAEAYIQSQVHVGWTALPERYDDGGYTGANLERPALRKLLVDIEAGRIDCVLVYKVDRLSRSLLDFARLMEILERCNVSLVSITQPLNTTGSLGRLTLNILLSFAEFERTMIQDRTSFKMAAARRKGKWVGGTPVLGYDIAEAGGKLMVNHEEAGRVQAIFTLYIQHGSVAALLAELGDQETFVMKYVWELSVYFSFYVFPFINGLFTNRVFMPLFLARFARLGRINKALHDFLSAYFQWKKSNCPPPGEPVFFDFTELSALKVAETSFYNVAVSPREAATILDSQLENLRKLARFEIASIYGVVLGDPDAVVNRSFVESIDLNGARFDPSAMAAHYSAHADCAELYNWPWDPCVMNRFYPENVTDSREPDYEPALASTFAG